SLITLSATDSQGARVEQTLRWDLLPVNDPPYLETPEPITVLPGQPILPIGLFGISSGSAYENQPLSFVVSVKDESIMDPPDILYRPGESEGTLLLNHRPGAYGTTLVTITIGDGATNDATYTVQFLVQFQSPENQKPTLQWVRPAANASFLEGESIELEVKAEDADGFVAEILYQANGTPLGAGDPLTGRLAWMPTEPGIYVVEVQAVDDLGLVSEVLSLTLEVKVTPNEPPSLRWVNPSQSLTTMWLGESLKLEVAAEDQDGTIALLEFLVDEEVIASQTSGSHEWVWRPQEAGDHIIQARVQDDDGAQSVSLLRTVKVVPRPAPFSLEITHPNDLDLVCLGEPIQVELALKGSPPSGVVVHLFAGNELVALRSASPYTFDWTPTLPGDLMLQAVAYLDDGSQVSSSAVRLGVSKTCYQAGILVGTNPVADPEWIKSILFEMGVGSVQVATPSESPEAWGEVDLVIAIEDGVTGIQEQTVLDLEYLHHELKLPVFLMGNHLLQSDPAMEEALLHRWRSLIHLEGEGVLSIEGLSELSETGFFQAILAGRFGKVAPFKLSGDMDWAVATEGAEAIVRVEDVDGMVRFPAGGASLEERPRWVTQNFSLISQLGIENDRSRRALFQNAVAWLIGDSVCSNAQFPVQVKAWQDESVAGQWVEQRLDLANFGACELTGGMLWIDYPSAIELDRVDLSMGLGWGLGVDGHSAFVQLGRLAGGGLVKAEVSLWMRGLEPGWHEVRFCSESNNTQEACVSQFWLVSGDSLVPASIRMQMAEDGRLWLRVEGASGVNYQIEVSYDLSHWMPFAEVEGTLTDLPLESLIEEGHPSAYF
ncbi:MAG: Ig-like domain-containing protein, partial [Limisphaerales bacterium]